MQLAHKQPRPPAPERRPRSDDESGRRWSIRLLTVVAATALAFIALGLSLYTPSPKTEAAGEVYLPFGKQADVEPEGDDGEIPAPDAAATAPPALVIAEPPPGGVFYTIATVSDPKTLAGSQNFDVQTIWALDITSQTFLVYIPGAPDFANRLNADTLKPGTPVGILRKPNIPGFSEPLTLVPAPDESSFGAQITNVFPVPPRGGLTIGRAGVSSIDNLLATQRFEVESILLLDMATQEFLRYIPGAPDFVNTLTSDRLHPNSIVFMRRQSDDLTRTTVGGDASSPLPDLVSAPGEPGANDPFAAATDPTGNAPAEGGPIVQPKEGGSGISAALSPENTTAVQYSASADIFANPERGFYTATNTASGRLNADQLRGARESNNVTLVMRYFMLSDFRFSNISTSYLNSIQADFDAARAAGVKLIPRFSYSNTPGVGDASRDQILRHIDQLAPILRANSDVIAVVQAGFIGTWGEWAFTNNFVDAYESNYPGRQDVLKRLLSALPSNRMVQVRTPRFKYRMTLTGAEAARVGFHNDCFLIDDTDSGTYLANAVSSDKSYLASETLRVAMGGETCSGPTSRSGATISELERFHWSYINNGFHIDHINQWRTDGRYTEIDRRLGYRLELVQGTLQTSARPGDAAAIDLSIRNTGFAAPYNPRLVQLVLRSASGAEYRVTLPADPRAWTADGAPTHHIAHDVCLSGSIPEGSYELFLHLADPAGSLHDRPEYAVRMANQNVWESSTGYNRLLHTLTVTDSAEARACAPGTVTVG